MNAHGLSHRIRVALGIGAVAIGLGHPAAALADVAVIPTGAAVGVFAVAALACGALLVVVLGVVAVVLLRHLAKKRAAQSGATPVAGDEPPGTPPTT